MLIIHTTLIGDGKGRRNVQHVAARLQGMSQTDGRREG
jgi:hypothetical protein